MIKINILLIVGLVLLVFVVGCTDSVPRETYAINEVRELLTQCSEERYKWEMKYFMEQVNWQCIEYANRTAINPDWVEACCVDIDPNIKGGERTQYNLTVDNGTEFELELKNNNTDTLYSGGKMCVDVGSDEYFGDVDIGGQTINSTKCSTTQERIETNETICIVKRLKEW